MANIENINISVNDADQKTPVIIHLLEGPAPAALITIQPKAIEITGDITSPVVFSSGIPYEAKSKSTDAIVTYSDNPKNPWIKLEIAPDKTISHTVTGRLIANPDLSLFRFNEPAVFTNKSFAELIMKNPHCFSVKGQAKELRKALQNYQAKFNTIVQKANDNQGNTEDQIRTEFDKTGSGIPSSLHVKMPFFDGGEDVEFVAQVEIEVEMTSGKPEARFSFFTEELSLEMRESAKGMIQAQIEILSQTFTCIRVNK